MMIRSESQKRRRCRARRVSRLGHRQVVKLSSTIVYIGHIVPGAPFVFQDELPTAPTAQYLMLNTRYVRRSVWITAS